MEDVPSLEEKIARGVKRYLLGQGHPNKDMIVGLVGPEAVEKDAKDICFRAKRFLKITTGLLMLPPSGRKIRVSILIGIVILY